MWCTYAFLSAFSFADASLLYSEIVRCEDGKTTSVTPCRCALALYIWVWKYQHALGWVCLCGYIRFWCSRRAKAMHDSQWNALSFLSTNVVLCGIVEVSFPFGFVDVKAISRSEFPRTQWPYTLEVQSLNPGGIWTSSAPLWGSCGAKGCMPIYLVRQTHKQTNKQTNKLTN